MHAQQGRVISHDVIWKKKKFFKISRRLLFKLNTLQYSLATQSSWLVCWVPEYQGTGNFISLSDLFKFSAPSSPSVIHIQVPYCPVYTCFAKHSAKEWCHLQSTVQFPIILGVFLLTDLPAGSLAVGVWYTAMQGDSLSVGDSHLQLRQPQQDACEYIDY